MARNIELRGVFRGERHVFENGPDSRTVIASFTRDDGNEITIKGDAAEGALVRGMEYRLFGQWRDNPRYGRQFWFVNFIPDEPATQGGVVAYLKQCDGIGPATAHFLWDEYGADAVRALRERPEEVAGKIPRFSKEKAKKASALLKERHGREGVTVELLGLLEARGFPHKTVDRVINKWYLDAPKVIRRNPYALMMFKGCGFLKCDKFYLDLGLPAGKLKRQALCAWHAIAKDSDGSTWHPKGKVESAVEASIAGADADPQRAIELAVRAGMLAVREHKGRLWLAEHKKARNEEVVAAAILDALEEQGAGDVLWPDVSELPDLSEHQREEAGKALAGRIGVLRGAPGTGKTFTAAAIIKAVLPLYGSASVAVAAPTGKAAVRLTEALDSAGVSLPVATIHRTLKVQASADGGWSFYHGEGEPLPQRFLIVDESSMIDTDLMASLLRARATGTHVLFVGDPYQLPPVGHGRPFLDLMTGGVPTGELTEIRRNSGRIVRACATIRDRRTFEPSPEIDLPEENLCLAERTTPQEQLEKLDYLLNVLREQGEALVGREVDATWDVQVLVAVNKRSELNRVDLNRRLQSLLNPDGQKLGGHPFRVGDKAVCLKNGWYAEQKGERSEQPAGIGEAGDSSGGAIRNAEGKVFVANGELAEVVAIAYGRSVMRLSSPDRLIVVPHAGKAAKEEEADGAQKTAAGGAVLRTANRDTAEDEEAQGGAAGDWDLGYALSVHKSQGSDWPVVVVMIDDSGAGRRVSTRNWLYTAISRAKTLCVLIGRRQAAQECCTKDGIAHRKTFLAELLKGEELKAPAVIAEKPAAPVVLSADDLACLFAPVSPSGEAATACA